VTTSASRQARSARNSLAEALGLGEVYPLRDLPVSAEPPVAAFGAIARITIEDSERSTVYRLLDQDGQPLPNGAQPEAKGTGAELSIETPAIKEDIRFTVRAARPSGKAAMLFDDAEVRVGLDDSLALSIVPAGPVPTVIDHGAGVIVEVAGSQEGVTYRLVARPDGDTAAPDDPGAMPSDRILSSPTEKDGTGVAIQLASLPLTDDTIVRVRAVKTFGGNKPTQTTLLKTELPIFVRPDSTLEVTAKPVIVDHGDKSVIRIAAASAGVSYALHGKVIADEEFSRLDPPDPAALAIDTPDGAVHILLPPPTAAWEEPEGFQPLGDPAEGSGSALSLPVPPLLGDTMILVEARKTHLSGQGDFTSAERLDQAAAILVRPDLKPPLRLAASVVEGKLTGLTALSGQPGIFYSMNASQPVGELYFHQQNAHDASLNKGVGALAVSVDLVVAGGSPTRPTSASPPPIPSLETDPIPLPADLKVQARRAMTGLTADLGKVSVAPLPAAEVQPSTLAPGKKAKVVIAQPVAGELYAVAVDGRLVADPVKGANVALSLDTGALGPGARVELWARSGSDKDAIQVERLAPLAVTIA
jgi:hypothetical protein